MPSYVKISYDGLLKISFNVERTNATFGRLLYDLKTKESDKKPQKRKLKNNYNSDDDQKYQYDKALETDVGL